MAGEYYRWLARDVKPEEKREMTREEKIRNWWYYHKWHLLIAAAVIFLVGDLTMDILANRRNQPDYSIAYVGSGYLPEDTVNQLTDALAQMGEDLNGNGKVQVALHQYIAYSNGPAGVQASGNNYSALYGAQVQLASDISNCDSYFFLVENPEQFQTDYEILIPIDRGYPGDGAEGQLCWKWSDCPVLTELPLGSYTLETLEQIYTGESRDILNTLYIGRRGFWEGESCENAEGCEALWQKMTAGAESAE